MDLKVALKDDIFRGATIKIAASNATDKSKAAADYVCDGTADDVGINAAIESLDGIGGCVELSEGTFVLGDTIFIATDNIWLKGQGHSTVINGNDGSTSMEIDDGAFAKISDLCITGNTNTGISIKQGTTVYISYCKIYGIVGGASAAIRNRGTATVINCEVLGNEGYGVTCTATSENTLIAHNRFENNTAGNINDLSADSIIVNNVGITGGEV